MRRIHALVTSALALLVLGMIGPTTTAGAATTSSPAAEPPTTYYVALGDSLATGGGSTGGLGYVNDIYAAEKSIIPGLQLANLACAGDSTTKMIHGGNCQNYTSGNQLGDAEAFLASHQGSVKFVTMDVGGDDVDGCAPNGVINDTCLQKGLQALATNMQTILGGLRQAGGNVPIVGMTYYDPWLSYYLTGPSGQQTAFASLSVLHQLNSELRSAFDQYHVRFAAVQKTFASWNTAPTGSFNGQALPQDVANICNWTHMCDQIPNVHTNNTGHALLAKDFETRLKLLR